MSMLTMSSRTVLLLVAIFVAFLTARGESRDTEYIKYTTVTGFFQQDDPATNAGTFDYVSVYSCEALSND